VLSLTGGAAYDKQNNVLTTPFVPTNYLPIAPMISGAADSYVNASGLRAQTAGYAGDALSSALGAFQNQLNVDRAFKLDSQYYDLAKARSVFGNNRAGTTGYAAPRAAEKEYLQQEAGGGIFDFSNLGGSADPATNIWVALQMLADPSPTGYMRSGRAAADFYDRALKDDVAAGGRIVNQVGGALSWLAPVWSSSTAPNSGVRR
jgi:hypothetical protein